MTLAGVAYSHPVLLTPPEEMEGADGAEGIAKGSEEEEDTDGGGGAVLGLYSGGL